MVLPLSKCFFNLVIKIWTKDITGKENIPLNRPFIFCANHSSFLDDFILPTIIASETNRYFHIYVNSRFYKSKLIKLFLDHYRCLPVHVEKFNYSREKNEQAFQKALAFLKKGHNIGIFPEGRRSPDGRLQKAKPGAARLALASGAPVLPIGISGSYEIYPKGKKLPRFRRNIILNIGQPMYFNPYYGKEKDYKALEQVSAIIMKEIGKLARQEYPS